MFPDVLVTVKTTVSPQRVFRALTGKDIRPWQERTLLQWIEQGPDSWGGICSVPTGLGKSMLPVLGLIASAYVKKPPRRIVFVVNRRIVVDETFKIATFVAERIRKCELVEAKLRDDVVMFREMLQTNMGLGDSHLDDEVMKMPLVHLLRGGSDDKLLQVGSPVVPTTTMSRSRYYRVFDW
jgi:Type III restriction enzyme, res subunit